MRPRGDPVSQPSGEAGRVRAAGRCVAATTELPVAAPTMVLPPSSSTPTPTPVTENGQDDAAAEWKGSLQSFVVGDPGNASKVRALPDATEWNHRDTVLDGVTLMDADDRPVVELRAASVRGLAHRYNGTVRQDDYAYRCTDDGRFLVCAVSDGVSSARLSHKAAALVTRQGSKSSPTSCGSRPPKRSTGRGSSTVWGPSSSTSARACCRNRGNPGTGGGDARRGGPPDGGDRGLRDRRPASGQ